MIPRQAVERDLVQGEDEEIKYSITTTPWGDSPTSITVVAKEVTGDDWDVVTGDVLSGSASVSGDVITLPTLKDLTKGNIYRIEIKFTVNGNILECYFDIKAER